MGTGFQQFKKKLQTLSEQELWRQRALDWLSNSSLQDNFLMLEENVKTKGNSAFENSKSVPHDDIIMGGFHLTQKWFDINACGPYVRVL